MVYSRALKSTSALSLVLFLGLAASGCSTDRTTTGSIRGPGGKSASAMSVSDLDKSVRYYGDQYVKHPKDKRIGLSYAKTLGMTGRTDQALAVMQQMVIAHATDNDVQGEYGKALAAAGNLDKALDVVQRAQRPDHPDWKLLSAEGAILDQMGKSGDARERYRKALDIAPSEASIVSNLGMSYMLTGDLRSAETYLAQANKMPGADSRVRQNLALAVGLQGRFDEAKQIASADLPPAEAQDNVAYLQKMLSQQNAWKDLKQQG